MSSQGLLLIKFSKLKGSAAPCTLQRRRWSFPGFSHRILLSSMSPFSENTLLNYLQRYNSCYLYVLRGDCLTTKKTRKKKENIYNSSFRNCLVKQSEVLMVPCIQKHSVGFCRIKCNGIHSQYLDYLFIFCQGKFFPFVIEVWPLVSYSKTYKAHSSSSTRVVHGTAVSRSCLPGNHY